MTNHDHDRPVPPMSFISDDEESQETQALLKILALGQKQIEEGRVTPAFLALERLRKQIVMPD
jgi:anti-sigma factor ChrR (cupin superfamily)